MGDTQRLWRFGSLTAKCGASEPGEKTASPWIHRLFLLTSKMRSAAEILSRKLAEVEIAIAKLHDAIGSTVAAVDPPKTPGLMSLG